MTVCPPKELNLLQQLRYQISTDFTIDDIDRIEGYLEFTKLNSTVVYQWLASAREKSMRTQEFDKQIDMIKKEFVDHLDQRIYLLKQLREVKSQDITTLDPWISASQISQDKEPLIRASLHIRDILFGCHAIIAHIPSEAKNLDEKDLVDFIVTSLPKYLSLLPKNPRRSETFEADLTEAFKSLERRILRGELKLASHRLRTIHKLLQSAAQA